MAKQELTFADYLSDISPDFGDLVTMVHDKLAGYGCKVSLQEAKSGRVVSFADPKTDKVLANFISRKKGPTIRIYADNVASYEDLLPQLPKAMTGQLAKASACRRLLDPTKCNARCPMGYVYHLDGEEHKKCRYNCFMFVMDRDTVPAILSVLEKEAQARDIA